MASLWIKIEHTTPDKPEVVQIAAALRIDQDAVVGKLFRLWSWTDQNAICERAEIGIQVTTAFVDRLTNKRGFEAALIGVNWARREGAMLILINFTRHNGETAKERAATNRRVTEFREKAALEERLKRNSNATNGHSVTLEPLLKPLPEEEEDKNPPTPRDAGGDNASLSAKADDPLRTGRRRKRLPRLETLRENLAAVKADIDGIRFPGGCAHERRPEELSKEKAARLAKLRGDRDELEKIIETVRTTLANS